MKFLKKLNFLFLVIFSIQIVHAQNGNSSTHCGSKGPGQEWKSEFQKLVVQFTANKTSSRPAPAYVVPVVVHIIHSGQPVGTFPNVSQQMVNDQIVTLNNDFAGTGLSTSNYPANAFSTWASTANVSPASLDANGRVAIANCNIEFCLAKTDTNGNVLPEPGIQRYDFNAMGWPDPLSPPYFSLSTFSALFDTIIKPQTIWDPAKYLNIWVYPNYFGLGGYAYYPALSTLNGLVPASEIATPTNDGIYCETFEFGSPYHIVSHEAGHWLGLIHTWGDTLCGNDYCNDTPTAPAPTSGSPVYPSNVNACGTSGNGVMFMNYMDYTNDNAKYMFTTDQANRMQTAMENSPYRKFLGTHNLCSVENVPVVSIFNSANIACTGKTLQLNNMSIGWPAPSSYSWSATGGTFYPGPQAISPSIEFPTAGIYTITLATSNGTTSVFTKTISVTSPTLYFSSTSQTICQGATAGFTVDGVSTYTWQPGNVMNYEVSFTPSASQTYTCVGLEINNCKTSGIVDVVVDPCTGIHAYEPYDLKFRIYPNPAKEILNLEINTNNNNNVSPLSLQITDAVGRIIFEEKTGGTKDHHHAIDILNFDNGIYFIKVQSPDGLISSRKFVKRE